MESARRATAEDAPTIVELYREGLAELRPNRGGDLWSRREARPEPCDVDIAEHLVGAEDRLALLGLIDDAPVGYALARFEALHDGETLLVVSDLYVQPDARGVGVGEALMDQLVAAASDRGAVGIDSFVLPGDRHSKNFFEAHGLKARAILVHRSLVADPPEVD